MSNFAKVIWGNDRYELWIDRILKAYSSGENDLEHEKGMHEMVRMAEEKGYMTHITKK